jgi:hypothetical protein
MVKRYGVTFSSGWTIRQNARLMLAVDAAGQKFSKDRKSLSASEAFRAVYKQGMAFNQCDSGQCSGLGLTISGSEIRFRGFYNDTGADRDIRLVVHELGHALDHMSCGNISGCIFGPTSARSGLTGRMQTQNPTTVDGTCCLGRRGNNGPGQHEYWGFAGEGEDWQMGMTDGVGEVWADMFTGWVFDTWGAGPRGENRKNYMDDVMPVYFNRIAGSP